jgi:hypothetical protein
MCIGHAAGTQNQDTHFLKFLDRPGGLYSFSSPQDRGSPRN